jgi:hypothetical protein
MMSRGPVPSTLTDEERKLKKLELVLDGLSSSNLDYYWQYTGLETHNQWLKRHGMKPNDEDWADQYLVWV